VSNPERKMRGVVAELVRKDAQGVRVGSEPKVCPTI